MSEGASVPTKISNLVGIGNDVYKHIELNIQARKKDL